MKIFDPTLIEKFLFAGNSTFTLRSTATGTRFTYKLQRGDGEDAPWFAKVLVGSDNTNDYRYAGVIFPSNTTVVRKGKKGMDPKAPSMVALNWYLRNIGDERVEFFHTGSCCACGRELTVPASIVTGFGPICAEKHGISYGDYAERIEEYTASQDPRDDDGVDEDDEHDVDTCKCGDCFEARCESREAMMRSEYEMDHYSGNE